MTIAIRYYTRGGNTEKLAAAISEALDVPAANLETPLSEKADILFLGSSYYAFDVDPAVKKFIEDNAGNIGKIVCFGTSAGMGSTVKKVKAVAAESGVSVDDRAFHCFGSFGPFHKGRPNVQDQQDAAEFAAGIMK